MPVHCTLNGDVVEMTLEGESTPDSVIQAFDEARQSPATPSKFVILLDVRKSTSLATRPTEDIIRIAEYLGPYKDRVVRCAVVASENIHFGLSRLGAVYSETAGVMTNVFRDRDEAITWLHSGPK